MEDHEGKRNKKGIVERIEELYKETEIVIRSEDKYTKTFWTKEGVGQRCTLSPVLFTRQIWKEF